MKNKRDLVSFLVFITLGLSLTLFMVGPYLLSVVMGAIVALLVNPLYNKLKARGMRSSFASGIVTVGVALLIIGPIVFLVVAASQQAVSLAHGFSSNDSVSMKSVLDKVNSWAPIQEYIGTPEEVEQQSKEWIQNTGKSLTRVILLWVSQIPLMLVQLALLCITLYFFLVDGKSFVAWCGNKIPLDADVKKTISRCFQDTSISVVWATLAAALAQSAVMLISYLILGVPAAILAGGATFIFAWIPLIGCLPVWVAGMIYLFAKGMVGKAILMFVFGMFAGVIDNIIRPIILKGRNNMHPLVSLVAIFGGIGIFGIMGVFIGPVIAAMVISLLEMWPHIQERYGLTE